MAYFDALLQQAITVRNNRAPASNTADLVGGVLVAIVTALQMLLEDKQDELTFDTAPTADSHNPVTSDGIYQALQAIDLSACEKIVNKVTSINAQSTDVQYPSAKLLYDSLQALANIYAAKAETYTKTEVDNLIAAISTLSFQVVASLPVSDIRTDVIYLVPSASAAQANIYDEYIYINNAWECIGSTAIDLSGYEQTTNKVTAVNAQSTDTQYPSAKCVYDALQAIDLSAYELIANKVTSLTAQATDTQYPSAKAVYDCCIAVQAVLQSLDERVTRLEAFHYETYYIRGTSTNTGGTETFTITMVDLLTGATSAVAFTAEVDANGAWEVEYKGKKIYSLENVWQGKTTLTTIEFTEELDECTTMQNAFRNCTALTSVTFDSRLNLHKVTTIGNASHNNQAGIFNGCAALTSISAEFFVQNFEALTIANGAFNGCAAYTSAMVFTGTMPLLADVRNMFYGCGAVSVSFTAAAMANVTNAGEMFNGCAAATSVSMPAATFASATTANKMFYGCAALTSIDLHSATFAAVTTTYQMFYNCAALTSIDLSAATFANLEDGTGMFQNCTALEGVTFCANLNLNKLKYLSTSNNYYGFFEGCTHLKTFAMPTQTFPLLERCYRMFYNCTALTSIDLSAAVMSNVTICHQMFRGCTNLATLNLSNATFASATNASTMFQGCAALTSIDLHSATFAAVTTTQQMFLNCAAVTSIDLSAATFANLENGTGMFQNCTALEGVTFGANLNLDKLKYLSTSNNYYGFFEGCTHLKTFAMPTQTFPLLERCYRMFYNCAALTSIDLSAAVMSNVTIWHQMYYNCKVLTDISVPQNSTAPATSSTANNGAVNLAQSPLNYTSMLKIANWLRDFTGGTAHTCTFKTSAWNALSAAEQANIDAILSAKNWTRAIA